MKVFAQPFRQPMGVSAGILVRESTRAGGHEIAAVLLNSWNCSKALLGLPCGKMQHHNAVILLDI